MILLQALMLSVLTSNNVVNDQCPMQILPGYRQGEFFMFMAAPLPIPDANGNTAYLDREAASAFIELLEFAKKQNREIKISNSYRSLDKQAVLRLSYLRFKTAVAAKPGFSTHQSGLSVDIRGTIAEVKTEEGKKIIKTKLFYWLKRNAPKFGWYNDFPGEPWHWSYVSGKMKRPIRYSTILVTEPIDLGILDTGSSATP